MFLPVITEVMTVMTTSGKKDMFVSSEMLYYSYYITTERKLSEPLMDIVRGILQRIS